MRAIVLEQPGPALVETERGDPVPEPGQILVRVSACGVCRTDLHLIDGELRDPKLPVIPGHQIVGVVESAGRDAERFSIGERVGIPWLGWACGECRFCLRGNENLCERARFTGYTLDGGYAELAVADERFCFALPGEYPDPEAAPLLCAGLIGYRALRMTGDPERLGLYGFGSSARIVSQLAAHEGRRVFAFTRPGDAAGQDAALGFGAEWAGASGEAPPEPLDAAIVFAPVGALVPEALGALARGGTVVCAGIHMSEIPAFPYELLWGERSLRSVANLTRADGEEFLTLAPEVPVKTEIEVFALSDASHALDGLRSGTLNGAAVLSIAETGELGTGARETREE